MLLNMCCVFIALPTTLLHNISTSLPPLCANRSFHCPTIFFKAVLQVLKKKRNAKHKTFPGRTSNYIKPSLGGQELHKAFPGWCGVIGGGRAPFHPVRFRIPFSPPRVGAGCVGVILFNFCPPYTLWRVAPNNKDRWALMDNTHGPKLNPTANSWSNAGQRWIIAA